MKLYIDCASSSSRLENKIILINKSNNSLNKGEIIMKKLTIINKSNSW